MDLRQEAARQNRIEHNPADRNDFVLHSFDLADQIARIETHEIYGCFSFMSRRGLEGGARYDLRRTWPVFGQYDR